jgi:hypothetical protein
MSDASSDPEPSQPKVEKNQTSDRADLLALGVGCAVFIIMFIAIVLVGMSGR